MNLSGIAGGAILTTVIPSAARAITTTSAAQINRRGGGVALLLDVTTSPGGGETLAVSLQSIDVTIPVNIATLVATAYTSGQSANLVVGPGVTTAWASGALSTQRATLGPFNYQVLVTHSAAGLWTYAVYLVAL